MRSFSVGKPQIQREGKIGGCFLIQRQIPILTTHLKQGKLRTVGNQGQRSLRKWLYMLQIASWTIWIKQKQLWCQKPYRFPRLAESVVQHTLWADLIQSFAHRSLVTCFQFSSQKCKIFGALLITKWEIVCIWLRKASSLERWACLEID